MESSGSQSEEARVFNDVDDLLDHVFRESVSSTLDNRFDASQPLTVVSSPLASPSTLDSRLDVSRPLTVPSPLASPSPSPRKSSQEEINEEKIVKPLKTEHWDQKIIEKEIPKKTTHKDSSFMKSEAIKRLQIRVIPGNSVGKFVEEAEKSPLKQTFQEHVNQKKTMPDCWKENERKLLITKKQIAFAKKKKKVNRSPSVENELDWRQFWNPNLTLEENNAIFNQDDYESLASDSDIEESAEEAEKSPVKLIPQLQTFRERLAQSKDMIECWKEEDRKLLLAEQQIAFAERQRPELRSVDELVAWAMEGPVEEEPVLGKRQSQMSDGSESDSSRAPARWPVPDYLGDIVDEIMFAVPKDVLDGEGPCCSSLDKKREVSNLLWKKSRLELTALHNKLFEHHPRYIPLRYVGQGCIDTARLVRANIGLLQVENSDSDNDVGKKEAMIGKVKKAKLAKYQPERLTPDRQTLTNAERQANYKARQLIQQGITPEEREKRKKEEALAKQIIREKKKVEARRKKRASNRKAADTPTIEDQ